MEALREYIFSVILGALLCSILSAIAGEKVQKNILSFLCGLFLMTIILPPLKQMDLSLNNILTGSIPTEKDQAIVEGKEQSRSAYRQYIKQELEAYILSKAAALQADISPEVVLSQDEYPIPISVTITGRLTAEQKENLQIILGQDLGIGEENQYWNG
ncbi:MAG: hypothetical protein J6V25_02600 [Oscillospiraceae bacterium]|nr:hypothetical protein [Oscillospiraceae bacterium]